MKNDDAKLIQRVLAGDDTAFSVLVRRYQKPVHALAWRKIGDFHVAEEITQDTFLKAYQKLALLKEPQRFLSWLYVIATNHCKAWLRKKRLRTESLENTENMALEKATYSGYVISENEQTAIEAQREVVKKLLAKLQESERTIVTLRYFGEMSSAEIGEFLGISANTVRSRLRRAQERLKREEPMIRKALENFQITPNLTENIMREVARLKPIVPPNGKPFVPWAIGVSTLAVIFLMLGVGSQHLSRFQKPYSFDAASQMTVELIEAPIVLNLESKPDVRTQIGGAAALSQNDGVGQQPDEVLFAAAQTEGEDVSVPKQQWIQTKPMKGSAMMSMFATPEGELYVIGDQRNFYKLPADGEQWQHISDVKSLETSGWTPRPPLAKWKDTLYMIPSNELFTSSDEGKTWDLRYTWQEEKYWTPIELVLTEDAFYVAFTSGILRSKDEGKTWQAITFEAMNVGFPQRPNTIAVTQNTMFVGARNGFYRFSADGDNWTRVEFPGHVGEILSIATTETKVYVAAQFNWDGQVDPAKVSEGLARGWWIFRSTDLGDSWEDITPTNAWPVKGWPPGTQLIAVGETLLAMEEGMVRSMDAGDTWMPPQTSGTSPSTINGLPAVALNERVFYVYSWDGLHRSTDGGKSWNMVNIPAEKEWDPVDNLIVHQGGGKGENMPSTLYATFGYGYGKWIEKIAKTTDKGKSWKTIQMEIPMTTPNREEQPSISQILKSNSVIYAKGGTPANVKNRFYRVSDDNKLVPLQGVPIFDTKSLRNEVLFRNQPIEKLSVEYLQENFSGANQFFKQLAQGDVQQHEERIRLRDLLELGFQGPFAVSDDTLYMEYHFKLFRWQFGETEWYDTGQEETVELTLDIARKDLKLAVSGNTIYVGKRDGHLVASFDSGNNWIDLTPALPFPVKVFKEIVFVGSTVYVATEVGVTASDSGKDWHPVTDAEGKNLIMEHLAVDSTTVYGVTENTGAYRLENGTWEQIISEIPDNVTSLAVDDDMLYVGTEHNEILHFNLEE
ncbi:MAG: sigma-70 family RNA polymerase sigma factor [Candidatus Poribacteria bacterium]|nr:sigma-70 family RNA polymerase sigma factor [Candidatus Poribacteria bacterium]